MKLAFDRDELVTAMLALALALTACSPTAPGVRPSPTPGGPSVSPTPAPTPSTFESSRHGYRLEVPPGWTVTEYEGTWTSLKQFSPGAEVPGEDVIAPADRGSFLVTNSMAIPSAMTAEEWLAEFDDRIAGGLDPACPASTERGVFAGESATIVRQRCDGSMIVGRSLAHGGRGYYFTIRFPVGDRTTQGTLERVVASIRFVEG